jgi:hypothetical protein
MNLANGFANPPNGFAAAFGAAFGGEAGLQFRHNRGNKILRVQR